MSRNKALVTGSKLVFRFLSIVNFLMAIAFIGNGDYRHLYSVPLIGIPILHAFIFWIVAGLSIQIWNVRTEEVLKKLRSLYRLFVGVFLLDIILGISSFSHLVLSIKTYAETGHGLFPVTEGGQQFLALLPSITGISGIFFPRFSGAAALLVAVVIYAYAKSIENEISLRKQTEKLAEDAELTI